MFVLRGFPQFTTVDPLARKTPGISPFAYCGNNPIGFIDMHGLEFTEAAQKRVDRLSNEIDQRQAGNNRQIASIQDQLAGGGLSDRKVGRLNDRIGRLQSDNASMNAVKGEIATLAASDQVYDIYDDTSMNTADTYWSGAIYNKANGNFDLKMGDDSSASLAHELKHAFQFETGAFSSGPGGRPFYDQSDEVAAYARGSLFGGPAYGYDELPAIYQKLPVGPISATNHQNIQHLLSDPRQLQRASGILNSSFRINGNTYTPQK